MDADLRFAWDIARTWPLRRRVRMRAAVMLYGVGLRRLAVRVAGLNPLRRG
jgi:hypothetical protein